MSPHRPDIRAVMAATPFDGVPAEAGEPPPGAVAAVEAALYRQFYVRPQLEQAPAPASQSERRDFIHALSCVNTGRGTWENGWRLVEQGEADCVVSRGELRFWAPREGVRAAAGRGGACAVFIGKEMRHLVPGFYMALGDSDSHLVVQGDGHKPVLRLYWHLRAEGGVPYVAAATEVLNAARLPFRTKVVADPSTYFRADAGVLYIVREDFARATASLREIHARVAPWLRASVPMFTKRLRDGLGLAEDPAGGLSFGQSRCRLAAAALWACRRDDVVDAEARVEVFARVARAAGLDPELPFLEAGSRDLYAL